MAKVSKKKPPGYVFGRPCKYDPNFVTQAIEYATTGYKKEGRAIPLKSAFATKLGVLHETINEWSAKYKDFSVAMRLFEQGQETELIDGGLKGKFAPGFVSLSAKNILGWRERDDKDREQAQIINVGVVILPSQSEQTSLPSVQSIDVTSQEVTNDQETQKPA